MYGEGSLMYVRDVMSREVVTLRATQTLREAAVAMTRRRVAAAVVVDEDFDEPAFLTANDIVTAIGHNLDVAEERVGDHLDDNLVLVGRPAWPLTRVADILRRTGTRHLAVREHGQVVGIVSVRDLLHRWDVPQSGQRPATADSEAGSAPVP
jgi:signal-transduction protein with cAMP-binding, CBS, and nucleotidyltransferase domain